MAKRSQRMAIDPDKIFGRLGNRLFQLMYIYAQARNGHIPDIYLQDDEYFKDYKDEIRAMFPVDKIDMVSIHVRRGDYVGNNFYIDLMENGYYERAMAEFPDEQFIVFSDDIDWCKKQELFKGCEFSEGLNEKEDMALMASCKGHIIANSSFSWWAAYIGGGKTIAPIEWHPDKIERTICPKEWIRL